jgi:hypothetical protein
MLAPPIAMRIGPEHHVELEAACEDLRSCVRADDARGLITRFRSFEHAVLAHLQAEEVEVLPAYARAACADAAAIRAAHEEVRRQLFRIGIEVELHCARAESLERLVDTLRSHAAHEDRGMYPWAREHLALQTRAELFARMARSLRLLARERTAVRAPASPIVNE